MKKATITEGTTPASKAKVAPAKRAASPAVKTARPKAAAAPSAASTRVASTSVTARIDVGFGNLLYIRGDAPGLSWDRGVPMECVTSDTWSWTSTAAQRPFAFKLLINDERWSNGDDFVASVGTENSVTPAF